MCYFNYSITGLELLLLRMLPPRTRRPLAEPLVITGGLSYREAENTHAGQGERGGGRGGGGMSGQDTRVRDT